MKTRILSNEECKKRGYKVPDGMGVVEHLVCRYRMESDGTLTDMKDWEREGLPVTQWPLAAIVSLWRGLHRRE